jgi:hypothetical protein
MLLLIGNCEFLMVHQWTLNEILNFLQLIWYVYLPCCIGCIQNSEPMFFVLQVLQSKLDAKNGERVYLFSTSSSSISLMLMTWCMARLLLSDHVKKWMQKPKIFDNNYVFILFNQRCNFHLLIRVQCFDSWIDQLCACNFLGHLIVPNIFLVLCSSICIGILGVSYCFVI